MRYLPSTVKSLAIAGAISVGAIPVLAIPPGAFVVAQSQPDTSGELLPQPNIVAIASNINEFSILTEALTTTGLADDLRAEGPYTVFAPTDKAFADLENQLNSQYGLGIADLLTPANRELLAEVLAYHVVPDEAIASGQIPNGATALPTLAGSSIQVNRDESEINVSGVNVVAFDVLTSNGVIHAIDQVLRPPDIVAALESGRLADNAASGATPATGITETPSADEPIRGLW
jgi:uncharacterized surface protein with fasciclin (FAS1) repeats